MAKLESLNTFFTERLLAVAGELYQAVTDIINEYKEETVRTKKENINLRKLLEAQRLANGRDDSTFQAVPQEIPSISTRLPDSNPPVIQVKVELTTTKPDNVPRESVNEPSLVTTPHCFSGKITNVEINNNLLHSYSAGTIKSEPQDLQISTCHDLYPDIKSESLIDKNVVGLQNDQASYPSSYDALQCDTAERIFYCRFCGKGFGNHGQLKKHMIVHQKDKPRPYCCDLCGKCFSYAQGLQVHRRTHTGERPFHCKFCGRCFSQKGHLKEHERIHTGEKPFGCPVCGKRFVQSTQVRKHTRYCHPTVQQR